MKARSPNGDGSWLPSARAASSSAAYAIATSGSGRSERMPATGSAIWARTSTVGDRGQPAAALGDGGDRQQQIAVVGADRDDVVGVVGDRRCQRALAQPETLHVADADAARGVVTLDADEFQEIPLRRGNGPAVAHLRLDVEQPGRDLAGDDADG